MINKYIVWITGVDVFSSLSQNINNTDINFL